MKETTGPTNIAHKARNLGGMGHGKDKKLNLTRYGHVGAKAGKNHKVQTKDLQSPVAFSRMVRNLNRTHNPMDRHIGKKRLVGSSTTGMR